MGTFTCRVVTEDGLDALLDLIARVADERLWIATEPGFDRIAYRANFIALLHDPNCTLINAFDGDRVIGNTAVFLDAKGRHVVGIVVDAAYRRRGIGRMLLNALIDWANDRNVAELRLEVFAHNHTAISLYKAFGFVEVARKDQHLRRSDGSLWDVITMQRTLP